MTLVAVVRPAQRENVEATLLRVLACATVALAPVEGYLTAVQSQLGKAAPALLIVVWLVVRVRRRQPPRPTPLHAVLALLAVVLAATASVHAAGAFTAEYTVRWLPFLVVTAVLADVASREVPIRWLLLAAAAGATVAGAGALYSLVAEGEARASGPQPDPNDLAYFLVAAVPLLAALHRRGRGFVLTAAGIVLVAGATATFSRGGALGLTAAVGWLLLRRVLPWRVLAAAAVAVAGLGLGALLFAGPQLDRALQEKSFIAATNVDTRELRWQAAARMLTGRPVLGVGPGGFREHYAAESHNAEVDEQTPVAHNMYLEVAAELGLLGFALFAGVVGVAAVASERTVRLAGPGPRRTEAVAIQASLLAVLVTSTFLSEQYYLPLWSLAALAVAAEARVREGEGSADAGAARDQ
ncbi:MULTISPECIES: O-antigen ligase family protein [unclassified Amycolatopsis]|uniref:O-antigen ligase family protein n=1 Tax=unclassified Amycolatopsis TaxID=2618356 RepID=UPI00287670D2|nr:MULTISPECIES: O-antigen ligase family protein [unclassified Amycolatopsis]MDS0135325.1 O-antigen ligase family protein [Amycolatopsis sp. 505]MDS0140984.1 O-antigen ligase family protein [Amycolatopsis sp. CM201R]